MLNVSRSGYYAWRKHGQTVNPRKQRQIERDEAIKQTFIDSKERSGARRIQVDLAELDMTPDFCIRLSWIILSHRFLIQFKKKISEEF